MFEDIYIPEIDGALQTMLFFLDFAYDFLFGDQRSTPLVEQRMNWLEHQETLERRGVFHRTYRMSPESFARLALLLEVALSNKHRVGGLGGPLIPEVCLHCVIRYLAGGSYLDICAIAGIPSSTFYAVIWRTCEALNSIEELSFHLPRSQLELDIASAGFESVSTNGIMYGCIGAIDGWL